MTANETGDFLAGFFAPLALLWLAAAVFIQSKELREQRRELALTREEFALNRRVATEQAEAARAQATETRRSADTFEQQTRYSDTQRMLMDQEAADKELQALIAPVRALHQRIQPPSAYIRSENDLSYALHFGSEFGARLALRLKELRVAETLLSAKEQQERDAILGCAAVAVQLRERISKAGRLQYSILGLSALADAAGNGHHSHVVAAT